MSFIVVVFGYNQFAVFNTCTSTQTLVDNIKASCLRTIITTLQQRDKALQEAAEKFTTEEENLKKLIKTTEQELKIEEEKEAKAKKIKEEEEKKTESPNPKDKGKGKKTRSPTRKKTKEKEKETENKVIIAIRERLTKLTADLDSLNLNKASNESKKKKIGEILPEFRKKYKNRVTMKIELVDVKGEKVNLATKDNLICNEYLADKTVYELNSYTEEENPQMEPIKFDGYCMRTAEEDAKFEENEKAGGKGGKKPDKKKK